MLLNDTTPERFWPKVDKNGPLPDYKPSLGRCWIWTAALHTDGYGTFSLKKSQVGAHRVAYALSGGEVPAGLELDHLCRVRRCVNPAHLEPVTNRENVRRGGLAKTALKTHCPNGHRLSEENTYRPPQRPHTRICLFCQRKRLREHMREIRSKS